jgi:NTP pyrophosphatase (non-canonical NTP hydrolase)
VSTHFNNLTPAEAERLAMLAEECGEVIQVIGKILRHGYESCHPTTGAKNRTRLGEEVTDVLALINLMDGVESDFAVSSVGLQLALNRKLKYSHHQQDSQR